MWEFSWVVNELGEPGPPKNPLTILSIRLHNGFENTSCASCTMISYKMIPAQLFYGRRAPQINFDVSILWASPSTTTKLLRQKYCVKSGAHIFITNSVLGKHFVGLPM